MLWVQQQRCDWGTVLTSVGGDVLDRYHWRHYCNYWKGELDKLINIYFVPIAKQKWYMGGRCFSALTWKIPEYFEIEWQTPSSQKWKTTIDCLQFWSKVLVRVIAKLTVLLLTGAHANVFSSSQLHYSIIHFATNLISVIEYYVLLGYTLSYIWCTICLYHLILIGSCLGNEHCLHTNVYLMKWWNLPQWENLRRLHGVRLDFNCTNVMTILDVNEVLFWYH